MPRFLATPRVKASSVNGEGSFIAVEILPSGTPSSARSIWSVVLMTVPQVPSRTGSTSSQSTPRKPELHGNRLIAVAPASRMMRTRLL